MRKLIGLAVLVTAVLILPVGCVASLAVAAGTLFAASQAAECAAAPETATNPGTQSAAPSTNAADDAAALASMDPVPSATQCRRPPAGGTVVDPATVPAPDPQAAVAVAAALTAVSRGGRYVAEGNGPVDFDCSGLTAWAWRQAGVSLVDYSYTQHAQTRDIPRELVQPGDLVFWFGGAEHHVAIVTAVADGQITIAEAANPDAGLRVRQLGGGWDDAYLTGFGRVVRG